MSDLPRLKFEKKCFMLQFFVTDHCQLACDYCLNYNNAINSGKYEDNIDKVYDRLVVDSDFTEEDTVRITLIGGEPLLEMKRVLYTIEKFNQAPFKKSYHLYTNGILLNKETIDLLNSLNVKIVISIDSLFFPNSRCKDKDVFDKIIANTKLAAENVKDLSINSVLSKETFRGFPDLHNFLKENKVSHWSWNFVQTKDPKTAQFSEEEWKELEAIIINIVGDRTDYPQLSVLTRYFHEVPVDQQKFHHGLFFQIGTDADVRGSGGRQGFSIPIEEFSWEGVYYHYLHNPELYDNQYIHSAMGEKRSECYYCIHRAMCIGKPEMYGLTVCRYNELIERLFRKGEKDL